MATTLLPRTIEIWQNVVDSERLAQINARIHVAILMNTASAGYTSNLSWKILNSIPHQILSWEPIYGFNWSLTLPDANIGWWKGTDVALNGQWQRCEPDQAYELNEHGYYTAVAASVSTTAKVKPGALMIATNSHKLAVDRAIYVVIGLWDRTKADFEPICIDTNALGLKMSAWYEPSNRVQWWYEASDQNMRSQIGMAKSIKTTVETIDMTTMLTETPKKQLYCSTAYNTAQGSWFTSESPPPKPKL